MSTKGGPCLNRNHHVLSGVTRWIHYVAQLSDRSPTSASQGRSPPGLDSRNRSPKCAHGRSVAAATQQTRKGSAHVAEPSSFDKRQQLCNVIALLSNSLWPPPPWGYPINKRKSVKAQNPGFGNFAPFIKSFRPWDPFILSIHITISGIP